MSFHKHKTLHKRDSYVVPASGSVVESNPTPTASILAQNTAVVANPNSTQVGIPLVSTSVLESSSTTLAQSSTPTASASSTASAGNQLSLGTVIGACVAALIALILAVTLAIYCSKRQTPGYLKSRNAANNVSRRRSHLEPWTRIGDDGERREGQEQSNRPMRQRPPSGPLGAMFHRTISTTSGEKSSEGHNRESIGTMHHFAKYHPCLAAEMASQGAIKGVKGVDGELAKPPPVLHLMNRGSDMTHPISLDGDTIRGDSFMSLHSDSKSPHMVAMAKSTPAAIVSALHRWESAEVMHVSQVGSDFSEAGEFRNPFSDSAPSTAKSSPKGENPFFSARDHPVKRTLLPNTHKNPFSDSYYTRDSSTAIRSLIAALEEPHGLDSDDRIVSVQSSVYSRGTADDGDSAISVTAFPYPPTQINLR
ncbi:hypothetical protein J3R82DRAFT_11892 [Butyriboletus roseoflavus]|nr:hypothetical protein J3R82DRAFT_11892 [Butyriboletus roseoflavus]